MKIGPSTIRVIRTYAYNFRPLYFWTFVFVLFLAPAISYTTAPFFFLDSDMLSYRHDARHFAFSLTKARAVGIFDIEIREIYRYQDLS